MEQNKKIKRVAIVGVGLIGGSFALTLKEKGIAEEVIGVDNSENNRNKALELKLVDRFEELHQAVKDADLIVLATPVDSIPMLAVKALNLVNEKQVVIDMGSTKQELSEIISQHPRRGRFVATHPMWGTEYSGPEAAKHGAFTGRTVVICDHELSDPDALVLVEWIYNTIGMPIKYMSSEEQDTHTEHGANPARTGDDWRNRAVCGEQNCPAHEQEAACEKVFHHRYPHYATQLNL